MNDGIIIELSLRKLSEAFDRLIGSCMSEDGKSKAPDYKALIRARGYLPPYCKYALTKKQRSKAREIK